MDVKEAPDLLVPEEAGLDPHAVVRFLQGFPRPINRPLDRLCLERLLGHLRRDVHAPDTEFGEDRPEDAADRRELHGVRRAHVHARGPKEPPTAVDLACPDPAGGDGGLVLGQDHGDDVDREGW